MSEIEKSQGLELHKRHAKYIKEVDGMIYYAITEPVPLQGMKAVVQIDQFDIILEIQTKQVKGIGAHYAKSILRPNSEHLEILNKLIEIPESSPLTQESIRYMVNQDRKTTDKKYMRPGSIAGRVSELVAQNVFSKNGKFYILNKKRAQEVLERMEF